MISEFEPYFNRIATTGAGWTTLNKYPTTTAWNKVDSEALIAPAAATLNKIRGSLEAQMYQVCEQKGFNVDVLTT